MTRVELAEALGEMIRQLDKMTLLVYGPTPPINNLFMTVNEKAVKDHLDKAATSLASATMYLLRQAK